MQTQKVLNSIEIQSGFYEEYAVVRFEVGQRLLKKTAKIRFSDNVTEPYVTYVICDRDFRKYGSRKYRSSFNDYYKTNIFEDYYEGSVHFATLHLPKNYQII